MYSMYQWSFTIITVVVESGFACSDCFHLSLICLKCYTRLITHKDMFAMSELVLLVLQWLLVFEVNYCLLKVDL